MNLQNLLEKQAKNYPNLSAELKKEFITETYIKEGLGFEQIAKMVGTYTNRIRRDAQKLGIKSRTKSEAQKLVLASGKCEHPTKGKKRSQETKNKIAKSNSDKYDSLSIEEKQRRSEIGKQHWKDMTPEQKKKFHKAAAKAVRKASVEGSKLEKFLHKILIDNGYKVQCHKEHLLQNDKVHIDLFLPELNIAIEVDGPSHSQKIWTEKALVKRKSTDNNKTALILSKGLVLIRVKQSKNLTLKIKNDISAKLLESIADIVKKKPNREDRNIVID